MYPNTGEGSIDLKQLPAFLSQFKSHQSGRIFFTVKEDTLPNGDKVQSLILKRESLARMQ